MSAVPGHEPPARKMLAARDSGQILQLEIAGKIWRWRLKLSEIYEFVVKKGIEQDPRGASAVNKTLERAKKASEDLKPQQRQEFDKDSLVNPYADTRILNGNPNSDIKSMLVGIDIDAAEILLADRLKQTGRSVDLVMAHH